MGKAEEAVKDDKDEDVLKDVEVVVEDERPKADEKPAVKVEADDKDERRGKAKPKDEEDPGEKAELAGAASDDEREKIRERRRDERKLRKERDEAEQRELRELRTRVRELEERHVEVERTAKTGQYERIEAGITEAAQNMERAKTAMQKSATDGDWTTHTDALESYNQWRSRGEYLVNVKNDIIAKAQQPQQARVDPDVTRRAREWMSRNPWYDPQAGDDDSKIAFRIDNAMAAQGFDPRTKEYWSEFDKRLAKQLPHRVKLTEQVEEADADRDETPSRTSGSGRERAAGSKVVFKISADRVAAMKEAGIWDDPEAKKKMIKRYMQHDEAERQKGAR